MVFRVSTSAVVVRVMPSLPPCRSTPSSPTAAIPRVVLGLASSFPVGLDGELPPSMAGDGPEAQPWGEGIAAIGEQACHGAGDLPISAVISVIGAVTPGVGECSASLPPLGVPIRPQQEGDHLPIQGEGFLFSAEGGEGPLSPEGQMGCCSLRPWHHAEGGTLRQRLGGDRLKTQGFGE